MRDKIGHLINKASKTPICDHNAYETDPGAEVVPLHIAQQLEHENAELRKLVEQMKEWLEGGCSGCCEKNTDECRNECRVNRLLEAAKGLEK